jgi:phosphate:Na+ symporter
VASHTQDEMDSEQITKILHMIGDYERISDHAVNVVESVEELRDKKSAFSEEATRELTVLRKALTDILEMTCEACKENDIVRAADVEPLEQVVDELIDKMKLNHVRRLQKNECTIELGFVLSDLLVNLERVSDHCSNIAVCMMQVEQDNYDTHESLNDMKHNEFFNNQYHVYKEKYVLP